MKKFIFILALIASTKVWADRPALMMGWNPAIPTTSEKVLELINVEAQYSSFETDDRVCGGEVSQPQLADYTSYETEDGNEVHQISVAFQLSVDVNYCSSEKIVSCVAQIDVFSLNGLVLKSWTCE